jgi:hypothetical protein
MNRRIATAAIAAATLALVQTSASAQGTGGDKTKAAQLATQKAKAVTYHLLDRSTGVKVGSVTLQRIGGTRSRVRVNLVNPGAVAPRVTLREGRDCQEPRIANGPRMMRLNGFTGSVSDTVVALPLTNLQSGKYLVDVQTATARQQAIDACSQLK